MARKQHLDSKCVQAMPVETVTMLERLAGRCAVNGRTDLLEVILSCGLSVNAMDWCDDGSTLLTLLHLAASNGRTQTVTRLLQLGADKSIVIGEFGTPLHQAAGCGHASTMKALLKAGCPVDLLTSSGGSVLHSAAVGGSAEVIIDVVNAGCNINARVMQTGETPLHAAASMGKTEAALALIKLGAEKAIVVTECGTPLDQAAVHGNTSTVKALLKAGCPVIVSGNNGASVLHYAALGGNVQVIKEVLTARCNIDATDNDGQTPLHWAAREGKTEGALELIRRGAKRSIVAGMLGIPLHLAARCGHASTVKALLKAGCPVDVFDSTGATVLHSAALGGNTEVIREVLSASLDIINATDHNGETPLHVAAGTGKIEAALELIKHGAEKAILAGGGCGSPLHQAAANGNASTVKALLKEGCPVNLLDSNGCSYLHSAALGGNAEVIREVLSAGCNINAIDNEGRTPLHFAALYGKAKAASELIKCGAQKALETGLMGTPIQTAARNGHVPTVKVMLQAGCSVNVVDSDGYSVLHDAAAGGNVEMIRELLSRGCDINAAANNGLTPLHKAAGKGNTEAALELIRHGAEKAIVSVEFGTPLHQAAAGGRTTTMKAMLKAGCSINVIGVNRLNILHSAALYGNSEVIKEVLKTGFDVTTADNDGITPLHAAVLKGHSKAALELIQHGASKEDGINKVGTYGMTPLHYAVLSGVKDCVRVLLDHGADSRKVAPYIGSPYAFATTYLPTVAGEFEDLSVDEDSYLLLQRVNAVMIHREECECFRRFDRLDVLERDAFGISPLEYWLVRTLSELEELRTLPRVSVSVMLKDQEVQRSIDLSLLNTRNLLLLATIHGLKSSVSYFSQFASFNSCSAQTVTSLLKVHYPSTFILKPDLIELVPPDCSPSILHVVLLAMKGLRNERHLWIRSDKANHPSLLEFLVTSDSFHHTVHDYLPNGLSPLDLAEQLGLGDAVTIIGSAGGRHGIYAKLSKEVKNQLGQTVLCAHQELMKLATSGPLGMQAVQAVVSDLPGRTTAEQGTITEESYLSQQSIMGKRLELAVIVKLVLPKVDWENWKETGILLQVPTAALNDVDQSCHRPRDKYREVLIYWLEHSKAASWKTLIEVLSEFESKKMIDQLIQDLLTSQDTAHIFISGARSVPLELCPAEVGATPPPPSPQLPTQFVSDVVHYVGVKWYDFALQLGISSTILDVISDEKRGLTSDCCRESLYRWLKYNRDTGEERREVDVVLDAVRKACGPVAVEHIQSNRHDSEVTPISPTPLLQSAPELAVLQVLVVPFAAARWEAVADYLLVSFEKRAAIAASERGRVEVCCRELFNQWLQQVPGTGSLPRIWGTVLDVVGEAVGPEVTKQIKMKLSPQEGVIPTPSPSVDPLRDGLISSNSTPSPSVDPLRDELVSSKPTPVLLLRKVVPSVAQNWRQIGVYLGIETAILRTFVSTESHDLELCCLEMFEYWLKQPRGTGESPRTWSTVLSAVGDCLGHDVADSIERALLEERRRRI